MSAEAKVAGGGREEHKKRESHIERKLQMSAGSPHSRRMPNPRSRHVCGKNALPEPKERIT